MDWVLLTLDAMTRGETSVGMRVLLVLELEGRVSRDDLARGLREIAARYPELAAVVRRAWHLAPYWRVVPSLEAIRTPALHTLGSPRDADELLETLVNTPFETDEQHLRVHLIEVGDDSRIAFCFDHRLFDARGAESFVARLAAACGGSALPVEDHTRPDHLDAWSEKFAAGRAVSEALVPLTEGLDARTLPATNPGGKRRFGFRAFVLNEAETAALVARAEEQAGFLMAMPFGLAIVAQVMHGLFEERGVTGGDYLIPVMADTRGAGATGSLELFNQFSFLLFRIRASDVEDFAGLVESLKDQMYSQVKAKLPKNLAEAAHLVRIVPLGLAHRVARRTWAGERISFGFSFLGETNQLPTEFLGRPVRRSFHLPTVPFPPGLGVFYRQARGRMDVQLTYAEGVLRPDEADRVIADLKTRLRA